MFGFDEKKKRIFTIGAIVYALAILLMVFMTNFERFYTFYDWLNSNLAVLTPLIIGAVIAYICNSLVRFFQNRVFHRISANKTRRSLSILCTYACISLVLVLFVSLIIPQLVSSIEELIRKLSDGTYLNAAINFINDFLNKILAFRGEDGFEYIDQEIIINSIGGLFTGTEDLLNKVITWATIYGGRIVTIIMDCFIGFLLSIYFILSKEKLHAQSTRLLAAVCSKKSADSVKEWFRFADKTLGGFIVGKLIDATFIIFVCSILFSIVGIPYSILVSVVIGVCNIIPFFGPFIGAIPSGFIIFIANPEKLLLFIILIVIVQQIDGNIIEPKIVGDRTGLSSLGVLVAVTIMSGYFGILGMFLGVPIFAVICAIIKKNIKARLAKKNLPTALSEYYSENSLIYQAEETEGFTTKLFRVTGDWLKKGEKRVVNKFKSHKEKHLNKKIQNNMAQPTDANEISDNATENAAEASETNNNEK